MQTFLELGKNFEIGSLSDMINYIVVKKEKRKPH